MEKVGVLRVLRVWRGDRLVLTRKMLSLGDFEVAFVEVVGEDFGAAGELEGVVESV